MPEKIADFKVAAGQHHAHPPAGKAIGRCQHRGQRHRAGRLDDLFQMTPGQRHRLDDLLLRDGDHPDAVRRENGKRARADQRPQAVGNRLRIVVGYTPAVGQRARRVVGAGGFGAGDTNLRRDLRGRQRDAGKQPATADRSDHIVEFRHLGQEFQRHRALAGDDVFVIVRRDGGLALIYQRLQAGLARGLVGLAEMHPAAVGPHGFDFAGYRVVGHDDVC